jgi:hypothetical protein
VSIYTAAAAPKPTGTQAISYSITREKAPVYTMGSPDVRAYSRNKRGIAGSLIWINFDRHALLNVFKKARGKFVADKDEIRPQYQDSTIDGSAIFTSSVTRDLGPSGGIGSTIDALDNIQINNVADFVELATPWYSNQTSFRPRRLGLSLVPHHNVSRTPATSTPALSRPPVASVVTSSPSRTVMLAAASPGWDTGVA